MREWNKYSCILVSGVDGWFMDIRISYYYCNVDKNNIVTDIWRAFAE
jgi:hypothetical protein